MYKGPFEVFEAQNGERGTIQNEANDEAVADSGGKRLNTPIVDVAVSFHLLLRLSTAPSASLPSHHLSRGAEHLGHPTPVPSPQSHNTTLLSPKTSPLASSLAPTTHPDEMAYPPNPNDNPPYPPSSYADPFQDAQTTSTTRTGTPRGHPRELSPYGGSPSTVGSGQGQRYQLSDSFSGSTPTLPTARSYSLTDPGAEKHYGDESYRGADLDEEATPLKEGFQGGFYRPEGQE